MTAAIYAPAERIWQRVLQRIEVTEDGCWLWTGTVNSRGYGCIGSGKRSRTVLVHHVAVMVRDGGIPNDMTVDHRCHDSETCRLDADCPHRRCVNPEHLAVVTIADNVRRQWESGKCRKGHRLREKKRNGGTARYCPECTHGPRKNNGVTSSDYWRARRERGESQESTPNPSRSEGNPMKTSIPEKALDLRDRGFAYYRIAGELNISKDDAKQAVATARDDRKTWLTRQGPRGAQDNTPYRRTDPKPPTKAERYVAKVRGQR